MTEFKFKQNNDPHFVDSVEEVLEISPSEVLTDAKQIAEVSKALTIVMAYIEQGFERSAFVI